jgi:hypothetical protein
MQKGNSMRMKGLVIIVLSMCVSTGVWGGTLLGPAGTALDGYRFGVGAEYGRMETDVTIHGVGVDELTIDTVLVPFHLKATEHWEIFGKLGGAATEATEFDGDWGFAGGVGARVTIIEGDTLSWGAVAQVIQTVSDQDFYYDGDRVTEEIRLMEQVVAFGPTWHSDFLSVYGGAVARHREGDDEFSGRIDSTVDIESEWDLGGYVGILLADPHAPGLSRSQLYVEGLFTEDSTSVAIGLLFPFAADTP